MLKQYGDRIVVGCVHVCERERRREDMCDIFLYKGPQKGLHEDINLETIASTETLRGMFYEF